jgi:hypothetical protein
VESNRWLGTSAKESGLLTSLPARRRNGFVAGAIGLAIAVAIYVIGVP